MSKAPFVPLFVSLSFLSLFWAASLVNAQTLAGADAERGRRVHEAKCTACHVSLFGGDGTKVYTRADRKVKTLAQLSSRVAACNANTGAGLFPDDEKNVAAWLNQTFYHFK